MLNLDVFVDALEDEVAKHGVLAVDLKRLAPSADVPESPGVRRSGVLIEMLRVWMEHRWQAGHPVSVEDCLNEFPNESFSERTSRDCSLKSNVFAGHRRERWDMAPLCFRLMRFPRR